MCHLVLLLPVFGLVLFAIFPLTLALPLYAVILIVSSILYYAISRAMHQPVLTGAEGMIGQRGQVVESAGGQMRVAVRDELWNAVSPVVIQKGQCITVTGVSGLSLRVKLADECTSSLKEDLP
jgi:membrane protein implicated in regulation of membrane protease activity